MSNELNTIKENLIAELEQRVEDRILERSNASILSKLINKAETISEAISISQLGTTYKATGLYYEKRLEKSGNELSYFKKNEALSFRSSERGAINKLIIGDNYDALQNLLIEYKGRVDVIYIDPPYGKDNLGEFAKTNYDNAISRDNLLSMLYPRLVLAKQLLSKDGIIFCSIDDRNQAFVKLLFDEVFDEKNSAGMMIWQKKQKPSFLSSYFGTIFEYILCYVRDNKYSFPLSVETTTANKKWPINNAGNNSSILTFKKGSVTFNLPDGTIQPQDMSEGNIKTELLDELTIIDGKNANDFRLKGEWRYNQDKINEIVDNKETIYISKIPFRPNHIKDGGEIKKMKNVLSKTSYNCETNEDGTATLESIFGICPFDNPKPVGLIELLTLASTYEKEDAIVLDFFAGSGTTGHSVLKLNAEKGGNRTFILCQMNEKTDSTPNGIAYQVTAPRLKRIMTGEDYNGDKEFDWIKQNSPYGGNLDVYEIEKVANFESISGKTPFDVIDETLYGQNRFSTLKKKVDWVCNNFEITQRKLESDEQWMNRLK